MADMLNLLIAKGGVSEMEPTWGSQEYQKGALDIQTKGLQNELARQQLAAEPEKQKMQDTLMKLRELGVTIREHAAKLEKSVTIPLNFNGEDYDLTAPSAVHIGKLGEAIEKDPSILSRKDIMTQLGAAGFSIKKSKEEKESPYGAAAIEAARQKDLNKAKIDQQFGTGGKQTVDDQALAAYLASNPGKTAADYIKWKEKQTYAPQVELYEKPESGETLEVNVRDPEAIAKANASGFNAMSPERKAYTSKIGTENAVTESKMVTEAKVARGQITTLQTLDQLADRFETGKMAGVKMSLQQYAAAFGLPINLENLSSKEAFNALTQQLALQSRNQGEGMVLAGQMSDRDVQFLRDMNVQMIYTNSGNKKLLKIRMAMAKRQSDVSDLIETYKTEHKGRFDATGFEKYAKEHFGKTSIFGVPEGSQFTGRYHKGTGLPIYTTPDNKTIIPDF